VGKTKFYHLWPLLEKYLKNSLAAPPGNPSDAHNCHCCCIYAVELALNSLAPWMFVKHHDLFSRHAAIAHHALASVVCSSHSCYMRPCRERKHNTPNGKEVTGTFLWLLCERRGVRSAKTGGDVGQNDIDLIHDFLNGMDWNARNAASRAVAKAASTEQSPHDDTKTETRIIPAKWTAKEARCPKSIRLRLQNERN